ncbi:MAG: carbamoyl-phosphate synthase large subunit [Actinomycetota bacterium]|nr:carbamoyl-phosphate synthase large subunit [Actinomycetota bacterium]
MPRRRDIDSVLIIGSGPIVIGQASEFDYSGTQACKVLKQEGIRVVLLNSNPATIMTDPELTDRTYVEPITVDVLEKVIERERPDACLPTLGGQTALNVAVGGFERGVFDRFGVDLIGADVEAIRMAEDRRLFREAMLEVGLELPRSGFAYTVDEAVRVADGIGLPVVIRPSFTLGGGGSGIASTPEELTRIVSEGLALSLISEVLVEEAIVGWKEYELEVMRDRLDNFVVVCSIENLDPMGVHTGDSITVAPAQTLTDREYQEMRDAAQRVIRKIGVETGGSNIQFAVNPEDGRMVVIEMNPRVSRSSALASKATGFPIAKIAAKLAIGYTLDEIPNDITLKTPACFEPTIDYVVVKIPRWNFEKFPDADHSLGTRMKSVGEVMAIGRTFPESLQKAIRSLETERYGLGSPPFEEQTTASYALPSDGVAGRDAEELLKLVSVPTEGRLDLVERAIAMGIDRTRIRQATGIDPWFLAGIERIHEIKEEIRRASEIDQSLMRRAKRAGFSDRQIGDLSGLDDEEVRRLRLSMGVRPTYKTVDTCAAEFEAFTPYFYSTYEDEDEVFTSERDRIVILGSGPNRIGQGIEFDYCCVHAAMAVKDAGIDAIMINCNPETVSTDYDTSTRLYFEPLTFEDVMNVVDRERPRGVIISLGGQTPLKLAKSLDEAGVPILGTPTDSIDAAEDRGRFTELLARLGIAQAPGGMASSVEEAVEIANRVGYPVLVRPSYVLGGRAMEIVYSEQMLGQYVRRALRGSPGHAILVDRFLEGAIEVDVDAVADGTDVYIGGVMEHIEEAGTHSGDSACVLPPFSIGPSKLHRMAEATERLARALEVKGLLNVQYAVKDEEVYCLEVNPRASRTVPFVGKVTGVPLSKVAVRVMLGERLAGMDLLPPKPADGPWWPLDHVEHVGIKEAVLPFSKFPGVDTVLGPEMKSTGEVMGIDLDLGTAFAKSQAGGGSSLPDKGRVFISVADRDKRGVVFPAKVLSDLGFEVLATDGTAAVLRRSGVPVSQVRKHSEGSPNIVDQILAGKVDLVVNTPFGRGARSDGYFIRTAAVLRGIPCITTLAGLQAAVQGIESLRKGFRVACLQEYLTKTMASWQPGGRSETVTPRSQWAQESRQT